MELWNRLERWSSGLLGALALAVGTYQIFGRYIDCVVALAFCLGLTWLGIRIAWSAYSFGDRSSTGLSFPMWIYYSALPAGGLLMSVRYIGRLYRFCFRYDPATMTIGALHHEPIAAGK